MASLVKRRITTTKNGKKITKQSDCWYIRYKNIHGKWNLQKAYKDKVASEQLKAKIERRIELEHEGIFDRFEKDRKKPLSGHLKDFENNLKDKGNTEKHARQTATRARTVIDNCKFQYIADIKPSAVEQFIGAKKGEGRSIQTCNFYLKAIKQFCKWLVDDCRTGENRIQHLKCQNVRVDRRHDRRALTTKEINSLLQKTLQSPAHHRMTGQERTMLYTLAISTGLRASELGSLRWKSLNLSDSGAHLTVEAAYSKHRREDHIPLRRDIADLLKEWMGERAEGQNSKIFPKLDSSKTSRMIQKDLKAAGIKYKDDAGRYADFHALRHTFITNLTKGGVSPRVAQSLARHSTITLTMDKYTHVGLSSERKALEVLPDIVQVSEIVQLKTGTDGLPIGGQKTDTKTAHIRGKTVQKTAHIAYPDSQGRSANVSKTENEGKKNGSRKSLSKKKKDTNSQLLSVPFRAEEEGFEPPVGITPQRFSRPSP